MKQPHEDVTGTDRTGDLLVSLEDEHLPVRAALVTVARHLATATLVGNPAPVVERMGHRLRTPQIGDLVIEKTNAASMRRTGWHRGFGYLVEHRCEWWHTDAEWQEYKQEEGPSVTDDDRCSDDAWYVQYGPAPADVCRWTNCSFLVIPITAEQFSVPAGHRDGAATVFTRDSLLSGLADSGFDLRF